MLNYPIFNLDMYDFKDKKKNLNQQIKYMLARTNQMFKYENLPDSIPKRNLELIIQNNGFACVTKVNGKLYAFNASLGGEPDAYYMPTVAIVTNPALNLSKEYVIDEDCVIIPNDSLYIGLIPIFHRYCSQLVENDLSFKLVDINTRLQNLLSAPDDRTKRSAEKFLEDIEKGKIGIIAENEFLEGIKTKEFNNSNSSDAIKNLIEYHNYIKSSMFQEIGLQSNNNMKREAINGNEADLNEDILLPLIDDMLEQRQIALDKINAMFGTDIKVYLNSSWEDNQIEIELEHEAVDEESSENVDLEDLDETIEEQEQTETEDELTESEEELTESEENETEEDDEDDEEN